MNFLIIDNFAVNTADIKEVFIKKSNFSDVYTVNILYEGYVYGGGVCKKEAITKIFCEAKTMEDAKNKLADLVKKLNNKEVL